MTTHLMTVASMVRLFLIKRRACILLLSAVVLLPQQILAEEVYQTSDDFIAEAFADQAVPQAKMLWLTGDKKLPVAKILAHKPDFLRVRYWQQQQRTVWILNEIGKHKPITVGVVVDGGEINRLRVLTFRESRGWEVKYPSFSDQFERARLANSDYDLTATIDSITGATLSVRAVKKMAQLALLFDGWVTNLK